MPSTLEVLTYSSIRNGVVSPGVETTLATMSLIAGNRPDWLSTVQTAYVATTSMMPAAMENRNEVFITDQGSSRDSLSRALRMRLGMPALGLAAARVSEPTAVDPAPDTAGPGMTPAGPTAGPPGVTSGEGPVGVVSGGGVL